MVPLANQLIGDFGKTVTYKQRASSFDPSTGKTSFTETASSAIIAPPEPYKQNRIDGSTIQNGDAMTSVAGSAISFVPEIGDRVLMNGVDWNVVAVNPVFSGELVAMYELQLRQ
jgi:hypothetical protein